MAVIVDGGRLLLIRRSVRERDLVWALPGGKVESGESVERAAVREVREETGLTVEAIKPLGERLHPDTGRLVSYTACAVLAGTASAAAPREVAEVAWLTRRQLPEYVPGGLFDSVEVYLDEVLPD